MSNLGLKEIKIPSNLKLTLNSNVLKIEGIFGKTEYTLDSRFILKMVDENILKFYPKDETDIKAQKQLKQLWGTQHSLLKNHLEGLSRGYKKVLELIGVGFRATIVDNTLKMKLGYSHEVIFQIPTDILIQCPKQDKIIVFGLSKQRVHEVITKIQRLKKIDLYKGKGILVENTKLRLKEGKKK